jgi:predicted MFS family arabinose efflux permease
MPFWLDDILHELGTIVPWLFFWFGLSWCFGYVVRRRFSASVFRFGALLIAGGFSLFALFMFFPGHLEFGLITQLFLFYFLWGAVIGFNGYWIPAKDLFRSDFWFPWKKRDMNPLYLQKNKKKVSTQ